MLKNYTVVNTFAEDNPGDMGCVLKGKNIGSSVKNLQN